jgi:hypothetical protein
MGNFSYLCQFKIGEAPLYSTILVNLALNSTSLVDLNLTELDHLANFFFEVELFLLTLEFGELSQTDPMYTYPNHLCRFVWLPSYAVCRLQSTGR